MTPPTDTPTLLGKTTCFAHELAYIKNPAIRAFASRAIELLPAYFFEVPASSSGKYHPAFALGPGGLVRHTRAAVRIARELLRLDEYAFAEDEQDLIFTALLVHDGFKCGLEKTDQTVTEHPLIIRTVLAENDELRSLLPPEYLALVIGAVETHMGQWTKNKEGQEVLRKPETRMERFVHLCDYIASRKCLEMAFEVEVA